ncbi:MAG: response regulator [Gammaproteobacteria bacterium]|nr:response regulator [Gammaproteobacteria bacterium]
MALHLLIVDDHNINLELLKQFLLLLGLQVDCAQSGQQAIEKQSANKYDLIFMDLHMPMMDGLQTTRLIRQSNSINCKTPIIALTADVLASRLEKALKAGMNDIMVKPVMMAKLQAMLKKWCASTDFEAKKPAPAAKKKPISETNPLPLIDPDLALQRAAGNQKLANEMQAMLINMLPEQRQALKVAIQQRHIQQVHFHAHKLHGASNYCGTPALTHAANLVETQINARQLGKLDHQVGMLLIVIDQLIAALKSPQTAPSQPHIPSHPKQ